MQRKDNILVKYLDRYTGEEVIYMKATTFIDGTAMDDSKCDGVLWRKLITSGVSEYFKRQFTGNVNPKWYGIIGDGTTNDSVSMDNLISALNINKLPLVINEELVINYTNAATLILPGYGINILGSIKGTKCIVKEKKYQIIDSINCEDLLISGLWYSTIQNIDCKILTVDASYGEHGTYWNTFSQVICDDLIIDLDKGSVNQNEFRNIKANGKSVSSDPSVRRQGGVKITGGLLSNAPYNEGHNNHFYSIDSSSHGFSGTDVVIINDSFRGQTNYLHDVYAEGGSPFIVGNWDIISSNIDNNGNAIRIGNRNHSIFAGTHTGRNGGDYFSATHNLAIGGCWEEVPQTFDRPLCLTWTSFLTSSGAPYSASDCPSGINKSVTRELAANVIGSEYQSFNVAFNFSSPQKINLVMWYKGDDFAAMETNDGSNSIPNGIYQDPISGWKLLRIMGINVTTLMTFYVNTNTLPGTVKKIAINSVFATNAKAVFQPAPVFKPFYDVVINNKLVRYDKVVYKDDGVTLITDVDVDDSVIKKATWGEYFKLSNITVDTIKMPIPIGPTLAPRGRNEMAFARNEDVIGDFPALYTALSKLNDLRVFASYTVEDAYYLQRFSDTSFAPDGEGWQTPRRVVTDKNDFIVKGITAVAADDFIIKAQLDAKKAAALTAGALPTTAGVTYTASDVQSLLDRVTDLETKLIAAGLLTA